MRPDDQALTQSVATMWSSLLGDEVKPGPQIPASQSPPGMLTSCIHITGAWNGAVMLDCAMPIARQAAATLFGVDLSQITLEQIRDAVGELANIVSGRVKELLPEPCHLSLPAVTQGTDYVFRVLTSRVVAHLAFTCQGAPLQVILVERSD